MMQLQDINLTVQLNRIHLTTTDAESSTILILWCGLGSTSLSFLHFMRQANEQHVRVIAVDPPGHGQSPAWHGTFSPNDVAAIWSAVAAHAKEQGADHVFIGGHSYGAYTALMALPTLLETVAGVVLLDGGYIDFSANYDREEAFHAAKEFIDSQRYDSWEAYLDAERQHAGSWDNDIESMLRSNMREVDGVIIPSATLEGGMQAQDVIAEFHLDAIPPCTLPVLLVRATMPEEQNADRDAGVQRLQSKLQHLKVVQIHSGHDVVVDNPQDTTDAVWTFLQEILHN